MKMADFLSLLKGVRPAGKNQWLALCPGHRDTKPSLSIKEADGKILVKCFAGCELTDIVKALELEPKDLFLDNHETKLEHRAIEAVYHYTDANGKPFEVVRTRPKGFYQRRPDGKGGYINNLKGIVPTLYYQDKLKQAIDSAESIYLVEGEKDADRLWSLGLVATTSPMGAGKWCNNYAETLRGADLIVIPDNDMPGREHANHIARSCHDIAKRIRVLDLPGESKDVSDWLDEGHIVDELKELTDACLDYNPSDNGVKLRCMVDVQPEAVSWLWYPYIPQGKLTLLEGDPGVGKSWVSLAIATAVSLGKGLSDGKPCEPSNVVIASAEDGLGDTIRPRLDAMGAEISRVFAVDGALILDENGFTLLESYCQQRQPSLLIVDPLVAYLGAFVDIHKANETRAVMSRLGRLAEKYAVAIIAVRHLSKYGGAKPIYRGLGSIDFSAACRSVLLAGCDPDSPQNRALVHIKSNLAPMGPSIGYELREDGFYWVGESSLTASQILATESGGGKSAIDEATEFLRNELSEGSVEAPQVFKDAKAMGIAVITLKRAKARAGIISKREGELGKRGGGRFVWQLPENLEGQKDLEYQEYHTKENDTLNQNSLKNPPQGLDHDTLNTQAPLTDGDTPPPPGNDDLPPEYPTHPCPASGSGDYWLTDWNQWLCSRCHPKPGEKGDDNAKKTN